jgi:hypothetical protein
VRHAPSGTVLRPGGSLVLVLAAVLLGPPAADPRQVPDAVLQDRVSDLLDWAHPAVGDCDSPSGVRIVSRFDEGVLVRFEQRCGGTLRPLAAVLRVRREGEIWQVAGGFEADPEALDAALRVSGALSAPRLPPPPAREDQTAAPVPLDIVTPPRVLEEVHPEFPEEAGRARLIGEARVELLVEVSPAGVPERARPLRGPEPDLGMHRAATGAALRWRFRPARLGETPVRYFATVEMDFQGLPEESGSWAHRALFHVQAIVSDDAAAAEAARRRLVAGEPFDAVARSTAASEEKSGDWGFVPAAGLPPAVRKALHEIDVGAWAGPIEAQGRTYLVRKAGEIYYAIRPGRGNRLGFEVLHQKAGLEGDALHGAIEADIADYLAESRRRAYVNEAARLMGIRQRSSTIGRLEIHTDVLDDDETALLGRVVQATIQAHRDFWGPLVPLRPLDQTVLVYAFATRRDHDRLNRIWRGRKESAPEGWSPGAEYVPASRVLAFPCEEMQGHLPVPILVHEAVHMLDFETVYGANARPSQWFEEGLATYFGYSQISSQLRIEPGEIRRSGIIVSGDVRVQFDPRTLLRDYLRAVREEVQVPLPRLLRAGPEDSLWEGERASRGYGASWTLVHFLKDGERGRRRAAFADYARLEARGEGGPEAFARTFGGDLDALERAWHAYEASL